MKILAIRHAESEGNVNPEIYNQKPDWDIGLTALGEDQATGIGPAFDKFTDSYNIFISPYQRVKETYRIAKSYSKKMKYNAVENPLLVERRWGDLRTYIQNKRNKDDDFAFFNRPPNGESFFDLYQRVQLFLSYLRTLKLEYVTLFTHGEWMKVLKMIETNMSVEDFQHYAKETHIPNCAIRPFYF